LPVILLIGILQIVIHVNAVVPKVAAPEILLLKNVRRKGRERWLSFFPFFLSSQGCISQEMLFVFCTFTASKNENFDR